MFAEILNLIFRLNLMITLDDGTTMDALVRPSSRLQWKVCLHRLGKLLKARPRKVMGIWMKVNGGAFVPIGENDLIPLLNGHFHKKSMGLCEDCSDPGWFLLRRAAYKEFVHISSLGALFESCNEALTYRDF